MSCDGLKKRGRFCLRVGGLGGTLRKEIIKQHGKKRKRGREDDEEKVKSLSDGLLSSKENHHWSPSLNR